MEIVLFPNYLYFLLPSLIYLQYLSQDIGRTFRQKRYWKDTFMYAQLIDFLFNYNFIFNKHLIKKKSEVETKTKK